jgi:AraC family transcriptional regulator
MNLDSGLPTRTGTVRDHRERINRVLLHLQSNPGSPLSVEELARIACFSPFHFHRLFVAYVGEPISAHVRRLRLERAAVRLRTSNAPVTEVALDAGYESSAAFNKAFRQHFQASPTTFRRLPGANVTVALNHQHQPIRLASVHMKPKPKIVERPEKQAVFVRRTGAYEESAGAAWEAVCRFAYSRRLVSPDREFIGISHDDPQITAQEKLRYDACITVSQPVKPEGEVGVQSIAGGRYAVFLHKGPYENLLGTYQFIFGEWLPGSGEELRDVPSFELYLNAPERTRPENLKTEIYIPLK